MSENTLNSVVKPTQQPKSKTLVIHYDAKTGETYPDGCLEERARVICQTGGVYRVGSELLISHIRCMVKDGVIDSNDVTFRFNNYVLLINKDGKIDYWPPGFCDILDNVLYRLLSST